MVVEKAYTAEEIFASNQTDKMMKSIAKDISYKLKGVKK